jgi:pimeloyl-ACP methyl ester carboxylesterase
MTVVGVELELLRQGQGHGRERKLLLLHGFDTIAADAPFLAFLARQYEVLAPSAPGFGGSLRPDDVSTVYDLVHLYLALLEALGGKVHVIGFSFGGWLAAEIAAVSCHGIEKLLLVDALGLKIGGRETADILDIFNTHPREVTKRRWHDPRKAPDHNALSDEALVRLAQNREALCLYGWHPYMYNPRLNRWLRRISAPTLVMWGAEDGIVTPDYGRAFSELIPGARFVTIADAGHHPEIEEPRAFADAVLDFLER